MQEPIEERVKRLREEIADLNRLNGVCLKTAKYGSAKEDHERRLQRLLEIVDELNSLTGWKKT